MISQEKIEKNKTTMLSTIRKYGIMTEELITFLGDNYFTAPSSVNLDMYGCYPGGLVDFTLKICKHSINVNETFPEQDRLDKTKILKTAILSQIGKTFLFKINENEWEINKLGKLYTYNELFQMKIGERSIFYSVNHGVTFDEEEFSAIIDSDKDNEERWVKWGTRPLTHLLKIGFELSVMEEKNKK